MALPKHMWSEHGGANDSSAMHGWSGARDDAKRFARKVRRRIGKLLAAGENGRRLR